MLYEITGSPKLSLYIACLRPEISHFSKELWWKTVVRNHWVLNSLGINLIFIFKEYLCSSLLAVREKSWLRFPSLLYPTRDIKWFHNHNMASSDCYCCCSVAKSYLTFCDPNGMQHTRLPSLSFTVSWSLLKFMSIESVMPSNHLILCHPLLILPSVFPSIRAFSSELALCIRWPKYYSFSFRISPSNEYSGLITFRIDWFDSLQSKGLSRVFSSTTVQKHQFFGIQLS